MKTALFPLLAASAVALACVTTRGGSDDRTAGPAGTIVVSNMQDNTATIIDLDTRRVIAMLPTGKGPHEVAVSHDGRWALVTNYGVGREAGNTITVVDVANATVSRTIEIAEYKRPHSATFLPGDTTFLVTSETSRAILLVDFRTGKVLRTLPSGGRVTHMLSLSRDGRNLVTANIADATITTMNLAAPDTTLIKVRRQPEGIAITPDGREAWVGSNQDSMVVVVDLSTRRVVDSIVGFGLPYRIAISLDGKRAAITDPAKGTLRIVRVPTRRDEATIVFPRDSILSTAEIPGSPSPEGVTISPDGRWAFVTLQGRNRLAIVDLDRAAVVALIPTGTWSDGVAYSPIRVLSAKR